MKKSILFLFATLIFAFSAQSQGYSVSLEAPNYKSGLAYFCYYMGKSMNIEDSAMMSPAGTTVFKGTKTLPGGIYTIVFPGKRLNLDFFIDKEQRISIVLPDSNNVQGAIVKGSKENDLFVEYQGYIGKIGTKIQAEKTAYLSSKNKKDSALHLENFTKLNNELNDYRDTLISKHPESMMAAMLVTMKEPDVPNKNPVTKQDSLDNYIYYKAHYWDGVTFMDERIVRTPFFLPKFERYYRDIVPQATDSIIKDIDYRLLYARNCPEMYKFMLNWFTDEYYNPKYMGQDAVFVHLFEKYHSKGLTSWLNEKQTKTISDRAYMLMSNLIGLNAANLEMVDSSGKFKPLYDLKADYTFVVFWDPNCGHCKEEIPRIDSIYRASWKAHNVRIYAVLSENDHKKEWVNYIKEHNIGDWTNVYETKEMEKAVEDAKKPSYRQLYDVTQTPTIFLLDKDKRIVVKKLGWSQVNDFLLTKWGTKKD